MPEQSRGVSRRAFAKLDGCSERLVRVGLQRGKLIAFDDGTLDPDLAGSPWRKRTYPAANTAQLDISFAEAQRKKEIYLGKLRQLEFEIKSGRLGDLQTMYAETFNCAMEFRDALTGLASREVPAMSPTVKVDPLTGKVDPIDLMIKIEAMHRRFLEHLAARFRTLAERAGKGGNGS